MFFGNIFLVVFNACLALSIFIYFFYKQKYKLWTVKGIPTLEPKIPFGNMQNPLTRKITTYEHLKKMYDIVKKRRDKHCGIYSYFNAVYFPIDLEIIRKIMTYDFQYFVDRGVYFNEKSDPLSAHLVNIEGEKWKKLRAKLTPTFTSGKMKKMFEILLLCGKQMLEALEIYDVKNIDIKEVLGCFTTDVIGNCAFGLELNSFIEEKNEFRNYGKKAMEPNLISILRVIFCMTFQSFSKMLGIRMIDPEVSEFFITAVKNTIDYREKNGIERNDFLQLLIEMKRENQLNLEEISAQCFVFFLAGFETSSTAMTFCLYELSKNQEMQDKIREEINNVLKKHGNEVTYEVLTEMSYMQQALNETLRLYPPVPFIARKCTMDYKIPLTDGKVMPKGTRVFIPIYAIHRDEDIYENPEVFNPERFSEENKKNRHPFAFMPFGEGPRNCIGSRFGLMQAKVGLILLLKNYRFSLNEKTGTVKFNPHGFLLAVQNKIWLRGEKIK